MKGIALSLSCFLLLLLFNSNIQAQSQSADKEFLKLDKVADFDNFYGSSNCYFSGQPTYEQFKYLKNQGLSKVINLRSNDENNTFSKEAFNEEALMKEWGIEYVSIEVNGKGAYNARHLQKFTETMESCEGNVLVHYKGAGRVTFFMMAYLMQQKGYTFEEAKIFGKQLTYFSPLDALLEKE